MAQVSAHDTTHPFTPSITTSIGGRPVCTLCGTTEDGRKLPTKRSIQKVVIHRAEGPVTDPTMREVTYEGNTAEQRGNAWLRDIARTAPATGGYDKTDVTITFSNGQETQFRFDVQHTSLPDNDTSIRSHVRNFFLYHCRPEELPYIARDPRRLEYARRHTSPETKAAATELVALLDADAQTPVKEF